ncbi:P-loop containing nucleoside triphosphate hydrolase protein [Xylogone sp. PMI_703]|nr:P-loop containing nucleoside triphosphate hydrolase protein [Xylogone sp. PMI_703]
MPKQGKTAAPERKPYSKPTEKQNTRSRAEMNEQRYKNAISPDPIGRDQPFIRKDGVYAQAFPCAVITSDAQSAKLFCGLRCKYGFFSQNPTIRLTENIKEDAAKAYTLAIGAEHVRTEGMSEIIRHLTVENLSQGSLNTLGLSHLPSEELKQILAVFGKPAVDILQFSTKQVPKNPLTILSPKGYKLPDSSQFRVLLEHLQQGVSVTLLRPANVDLRDVTDKVWLHRISAVFEHGIFPNFRPFEAIMLPHPKEPGLMVEKSMLEAYRDGDREIPRLPWLEMPLTEDTQDQDDNGITRYGSILCLPSFTSPDEYRVTMTLALLKDFYYQKEILNKVFNEAQIHNAYIETIPGRYGWHFYVSLNNVEGISLPKIPLDTTFSVKTLTNDVLSAKYTMHVTDIKARRTAFVLEFYPNKDTDIRLVDKQNTKVVLEMEINSEPMRRVFNGIRDISNTPVTNTIMQMILGHNLEKCPEKQPLITRINQLALPELEDLLQYISSKSMNPQQWLGFDSAFNSTHGCAFLLGPPGTGKSHVISNVAVIANAINTPVVICAPSRAAIKAVTKKIVAAIGQLGPIAKSKIRFTILPTKKESEQMALEYFHQRQPSPRWSNPDDVSLLPFQTFVKSAEEAEATWRSNVENEQKAIAKWKANLAAMRDHKKILSGKDWRPWWNKLWDRRRKVLDQATMLASTCNNLGGLAELATDFLDRIMTGLIIVDEAAFDNEYSLCIPLSLRSQMSLIVGDHYQLQPVVASKGFQEFSEQCQMSLFQRCVDYQDVEVNRLQITYRFPRHLADIPGVLSGYNGLVTQKSRVHDNDPAWQLFETWFQESRYAPLRRSPFKRTITGLARNEFDRLRQSSRRLLFNVRGRSGRAPGSMSTVNFANINAICNFVGHVQEALQPEFLQHITILVPFAAQLEELTAVLEIRQLDVQASTFDSFQGDENDFIILDLTPANWNDAAFIGFLSNWNRLNVAITRARQGLYMFGNLDLWRTRIAKVPKQFALMLMDIVDRGDVIELEKLDEACHRLPADRAELIGTLPGNWTYVSPDSQERKPTGEALPIRGINDAETLSAPDHKLIQELDKLRIQAAQGRKEAAESRISESKFKEALTKRVREVRKEEVEKDDEFDIDINIDTTMTDVTD